MVLSQARVFPDLDNFHVTAAVVIVSPLFPPARGGLADHTGRLACELAKEFETTVVTSAGAGVDPGPSVCPTVADWREVDGLVAALETISSTAPVLWQYVPHMYGRGGVNGALPRAMLALRRKGRRQFVIAHEIAAPWSAWPHRFWYAVAQRRQWRRILACADAVGFSTETWLERWRRRAPAQASKFFLVPSPSSVPVVAESPGHGGNWRRAHGLDADARVLTYFGTLSASKQFSWVMEAWRQAQVHGRPVALVIIGDRPGTEVPAGLAALYKPLGYLPAPEVSAALQATEVLALPFVDGVSERRTTFMAGLSHGCAVVTTTGESTGPTLRRAAFFKATSASDRDGYSRVVAQTLADEASRGSLGAAAGRAYAQAYDWPVVARTLRDRLQSPEATPASA